jgi:acid phosphatase
LEFANHWQNFLIESYLQLEYAAGPYNGLADAYQRGADYAIRYGHLWDGESVVPIFAGGYERVLQTGRKFGEGFLGYNYSTLAAVQVIPETAVSGANSVAPVCNAEVLTTCNVANNTSLNALLSPFLMPEFQVAANRLNIENPALNATAVDVYYLLQLTAYEIAYRGNSQWAEVFTDDEFLAFDYAFSLLYYCYYGPGSPTYGQQIGSVFANASLTVLKQGPEVAGTMFWTFSHDAYVTAALSAMGILMPSEPSLDKVNFNYMKTYKISDIVPMAGHLTIERLSCSAEVSAPYISANQTDNGMPVVNATTTYGSANVSGNQTYVRLVLNEAVLPVDGCIDGPGYSCSLDSYDKFLSANLANFDYVKACNISQSLPQYLDFFWNWNHTTEHNYPSGPVPYQATYVTN